MFKTVISVFSINKGIIVGKNVIEGVSYQGASSLSIQGMRLSETDETMIIIPLNKLNFKINKGDKIIKGTKDYEDLKELNKDSVTVKTIIENNFGSAANVELRCV